jgi:hypothetical protein
MKQLFLLIFLIFSFCNQGISQVGIGTNAPHASAMLDLQSTNTGILIPRVSLAQLMAISNPANGLQVFCYTDSKLYIYISNENKWKEVAFGPGSISIADDDSDGIIEALDNCPLLYNPDQIDSDADGAGDACDLCQGFDDKMDTDLDGVPDGCDVCAGGDDNLDSDGDEVPDACDLCAGFDDSLDTDADTVPDGCDLCQGFDDRIDTDLDGVPDGCDVCAGGDDNMDSDNDGVPDACDNCPNDYNPEQTDTDMDGIGDACDI